MQRSMLSLVAVICALALPGWLTEPVEAAFATFVSQTGSDAFDCITPAEPCATLAGALAKTNALGVMHVLPGQYAPLTIDKAVEIIADGGQASITGSAGDGSASVIVNAASTDVVRIRGLIIDRKGDTITHGIRFIAGAALHVEDCTLVNAVSGFGLNFAPSGASELYVSNSSISGNGSGGILIKPSGSGSAKAVLDNSRIENNLGGVVIDGRATTGTNSATIRNSTVSGGGQFGIYALDNGGGATNVLVEGSTSADNGTFGVGSNGVNSTVRMRNSTVTGNGTGLAVAASGKLISIGGNAIRGNAANGAFTATEAQQ